METALSTLEVLGIHFVSYNKHQLLRLLANRISQTQKTLVLSGNIHAFNLAYEQPWLKGFFNRADAIRIDGAGLRLGARLLGQTLPPRMTWADFMWELVAWAEPTGYRLFFVGAQPGVAAAAAHQLRQRHPHLNIVGCEHGYFNQTRHHPENQAVLAHIRTSHPDILIVGLGMPRQERWLYENEDAQEATVIMTAGAVLDYISGQVKRPAPLFTQNGFEWLGRFLGEPRRLWRRYLIGNPLFLWRVLHQRFRSPAKM